MTSAANTKELVLKVTTKQGWECGLVVKHSPSICETLGVSTTTTTTTTRHTHTQSAKRVGGAILRIISDTRLGSTVYRAQAQERYSKLSGLN